MNDSIRDIVKRVDSVGLMSLSHESLAKMDSALAVEQKRIEDDALSLERGFVERLENGDVSALSESRKSIRQLARRHHEIEEERERVRDARQERVVEEKLALLLGSRRRVEALEGTVLCLIVFVLSLLVYEFTTPDLSLAARTRIFWIDFACCIVFLAEFFLRLSCAESKSWFWKRHWLDFATSIPIPDLEVLRFGRGARLVRVVRMARLLRFARLLRALRIVFFFWRGMDKLHEILDVRLMKRSLYLAFGVLLLGAVVMHYVEGGASEGVSSFPEVIWWSFTTVVTGGYGDIHNPMSIAGRLLTVILVLAGMTVIGIFTATLTSSLVDDENDEMEIAQKRLEQKIDRIERMLGGEKQIGLPSD